MELDIDKIDKGFEFDIKISGIDNPAPFTIIAKNRDCTKSKTGRKQNTVTVAGNFVLGIVPWYENDPTNWKDSHLRRWLNSEFYMRLPIDIRNNIQPKLNKTYDYWHSLSITDDPVWVPSLDELGRVNTSLNDGEHEGSAYEYLVDNQDFVVKELINTGIQCNIWTRSLMIDEDRNKIYTVGVIDDVERLTGVVPFFVLRVQSMITG